MSYRKKLLLIFVSLFFVYALIILFLQAEKEKEFQTHNQKEILKTYGKMVEKMVQDSVEMQEILNFLPQNVRLSYIDSDGELLYDNIVQNVHNNHIERPEINEAQNNGYGFAIRKSKTTHQEYLYYAFQMSEGSFIRLALPYIIQWKNFIDFDNILLYIVLFLFFVVLLLLILKTEKFDSIMQSLSDFASAAENGNVDDQNVHLPNTPFGEISKKIISLYKQLENSKLQIIQEKENRQKLKQEMTNNIAHELKTPVSSIRGYLEILLENRSIDEEQRNYFLKRSYAQTLRLSDLIQDVSLITKLEESAALFSKEKLEIRSVFEEAVAEWTESFSENRILVENHLTEDMIIAGNHNLLFSIFRNLLENAFKYAGTDISIFVECLKKENNLYFLRFYDTGAGIPMKFADKIFERFFRINKGRSRKNGGTGLGLSIVKHSVQFHGGTITAFNRKEGGLVFDFTLSVV